MLLLSVLAVLAPALASSILVDRAAACTADYRRSVVDGVAPAFSDQTPGATAKFIQSFPLKDDATLTATVNGLPVEIPVGFDASTFRTEGMTIRQLLYKITPTMSPATIVYANGTTHTPYKFTLGAAHTVSLPVTVDGSLDFTFDLDDCMIENLNVILTRFPSTVLGQPLTILT